MDPGKEVHLVVWQEYDDMEIIGAFAEKPAAEAFVATLREQNVKDSPGSEPLWYGSSIMTLSLESLEEALARIHPKEYARPRGETRTIAVLDPPPRRYA